MAETPVASVKRPFGVWAMTVIDGLFAGVFLVAAAFRAGLHELGFPLWMSIGWGVLGIAITISAQIAWYGSRHGRTVLLVLMAFYLGLGLLQNGRDLIWALRIDLDNTDFFIAQLWSVLRAVVWLAANIWFLTGRRTRGFYA